MFIRNQKSEIINRIPAKYKILNTTNRKRFAGIIGIIIFTLSIILSVLTQIEQSRQVMKPPNLPYQEKVADGVWELKNREPVHQVLASSKEDLNLKQVESSKLKVKSGEEEVYKWYMELSSGTKFEFGACPSEASCEGGVLPEVKITNKEGFYVRYSPHKINTDQSADIRGSNQRESLTYVEPKVRNNIIEWEIADGITARYTMMEDRVKADYIVDSKDSLCHSEAQTKNLERSFTNVQDDSCSNPKLEFDVESGNINNKPSAISNQPLVGSLMPNGDIAWLSDLDQEVFTFPAPVVKDSSKAPRPGLGALEASDYSSTKDAEGGRVEKSGEDSSRLRSNNNKEVDSEYSFSKTKTGEYSLGIVLDPNDLEKAQFPLVIDPVAIDSAATATGTAYGNGRKIHRDAWGNLIAVFDGSSGNDSVYTKDYDATSWTDEAIDLGTGSSFPASDIDSSGNIHVVFRATTASYIILYSKLTVNRDGNNRITSVSAGSNFTIESRMVIGGNGTLDRPSLIIANKGGGAGVEKVAVAYASNSGASTIRGEIRFMQCDVADNCTTAANWKNASEEINGNGTCSDSATSGDAGLPNATTCKGTADKLFAYTAAHTIHHGVLTQMPGKPRRTPLAVKVYTATNSAYRDLGKTLDNNTGTTEDVSSFGSSDYLYIGDDKPFSKITVDVTNTNSTAFTDIITRQYCSAVSAGNCTTWSSVSDFVDSTNRTTNSHENDGSILFNEPSDWVKATVDGVADKYWIRLRPAGSWDSTVSVAEYYINDRNSKALLIVGGVDSTDDLRAAYIVWDEINNDRWEKYYASGGAPWRADLGGASSALDDLGGNWGTFTNFPLTATVDYKNNAVYVSYVCDATAEFDCGGGFDTPKVKYAQNNKDLTVAANWLNVNLAAGTVGTDIVLSLTADGADIYLFYVLDPGTNSYVFRRCTGSGGGLGGICDNASDWGSEKILDNGTDNTHPQAVVTKVTGDTIAIDSIYTTTTGPAVEYERHYADLADRTVVVAAISDNASHNECESGTDDQYINGGANGLFFGRYTSYAGCDASANAENHVGYRFPAVVVAQGSPISSAFIDLHVNSMFGTGNAIDFTIYGEDVDDSASFTALSNCTVPCSGAVGERTRTTSSISHAVQFDKITYRFDVTDIVQEIVCRGASSAQPCVGDFNGSGTWASGNDLTILLISSEGGPSNLVNLEEYSGFNIKPTLQINVGSTGKNYSLGSATQLATGSATLAVADLDHPLSASEMGAVLTDDTNYASVSATTNYASASAQPAFMFKQNNSNNTNGQGIDATAVVRSSLPTTTHPIHMQVYRGGSTDNWVDVAVNNNTPAGNDITLNAIPIISNPTDYYFNETPGIGTRYAECTDATANCWTYFRVYQENPGTSQNAVLEADYFNVTFNDLGPSKIVFTNATRTLTQNVCNGAGSVFTMQLQNSSNEATNPLATTVVRVTSNSSSYIVYSDDTCTTEATNGDFTYTTSQNTKSVYIKDNAVSTTYTLTGTRQSGDTLTTGNQNYSIAGPTKVVFTNANRTINKNVCNGAANVFTMELQDAGGTPTNPSTSTVVRITSNSGSYTIYSDATCETVAGSGDFTFTTGQNSKSVYIIDTSNSNPYTLTATRQSGHVLITSTHQQNYVLAGIPTTRLKAGSAIFRSGTRIK